MYQEFASVYDEFMDDFDYSAWADYYIALLGRSGFDGGEICECACGTGSLSVELLKRGFKLTCSDISEGMLRIASQKALKNGLRARFVKQDMRQLELPHAVDALICACDGVNYMLSARDAMAFFRRAYAALKAGGAIAFDISSRHKLRDMLGGGFFGEERADAAYLWQNTYDPQKYQVTMELTFFVEQEGGLYRRFSERQVQRAHSAEEITAWLNECGFCNVQIFGDRSFEAPRSDELRLHFTAVKPKAVQR